MQKKTMDNGQMSKRISVVRCVGIWACVFFVVIVGCLGFWKMFMPTIFFAVTTPAVRQDFPESAVAEAREEAKALLMLAKREYENPKSGEFYAEGVNEPWCADFVSYLYKEAGHPFKNPNTGHWRIPGIYTLREYLQSVDAWHSEPDYVSRAGDIVIYDGGLFGGHTNIVVSVEGDYAIVIGGNEGNQVWLDRINWRDDWYGVQGFGSVL